ncbi:MAG TPA: formate--tetrahydrofolate ligase, partial [Bacteroidetes bacterium]|nr:formate--tetrahydrofolate ligase [Bacteroidota bacterium]
IQWKRVIDMNDRALRDTVIGLGGTKQGIPRQEGFDITAASEVMATLCMAENLKDLKERLGNIYIGETFDGKSIFARDLHAHGAMAALLKDAIKPNLVQTLEETPAIIHGGPFANIAQGTNTIIATKMGMSLSDYVVTEAGFASELGAEKFFDIKCQQGGLSPHAVVIVATIRALKYHGGAKLKELAAPDMKALQNGFDNLDKHIENMQLFGFNPVVAINKFVSDTSEEIDLIMSYCKGKGIRCAINDSWEKGGEGAVDLAELVVEASNSCPSCFTPLYKKEERYEEKIDKIAKQLYGAKNVEYSVKAKEQLDYFESMNLSNLAVCMAKTQKSLSDNPNLKNRPKDFTVKIREIELSAGAGFIVPIAGNIMRMPGLPSTPSAEAIDIDENGNISGLF